MDTAIHCKLWWSLLSFVCVEVREHPQKKQIHYKQNIQVKGKFNDTALYTPFDSNNGNKTLPLPSNIHSMPFWCHYTCPGICLQDATDKTISHWLFLISYATWAKMANNKLYPTNLLMASMKLFYNFQTFAMKMRCQGRMHCASKESKKYEILILFSSPRKNNLKQNFQAFQVFTLQPGQLLSSRVVLVCKCFLHVSIQKPRIVLRIC